MRPPQDQGRRARSPIVSYRASIAAIAILAGFFGLLVMVVLSEHRLARVVDALASGHDTADLHDVPFLASLAVVPVACALAVAVVAAATIKTVRIGLYVGRVHRHAETYLRRYAQGYRREGELRVVPVATATLTRQGAERNLTDALRASRRLLVLGPAGAGKTVALYAMLHRETRPSVALGLCLGRRPLPVLLALGDWVEAESRELPMSLESRMREHLSSWGTPGLAARLSTLKRRQGLLVLGDQLDWCAPACRSTLSEELLALTHASATSSVVATYQTPSSAAGHDLPEWCGAFQAVALAPLSEAAVRRTLLGTRAPRAAGRPRMRGLGTVLARHRLEKTVRQPSGLAALASTWPSNDSLPVGPAELYHRSLDLAMSASAPAEGNLLTERSLQTLGAIAAAMRRAGTRTLPLQATMSVGVGIALWLSAHEPLPPTEAANAAKLALNASDTDVVVTRAIERGVLATSSPGAPITFAHSMLEVACAAWWLRDGDDGLSRLSPELLRPEWTLPVIFWAGSCDAPTDLARRLMRLADTPEASAPRAGLPSSEMVWPTAMSLSLAAACEGVAVRLAHLDTKGEDTDPFLAASEQDLRDLLDAALAHIADGNAPAPIATALREMASRAGPDLCDNVEFLARDVRLSGLVRAQLVTLMGALALPEAVELLVARLTDPDPLTRQALPVALGLAGPQTLDALRLALRHADQHTRERAAETLAGLGDIAVPPLLAALQGNAASEREAAAWALRALRPPEAEAPLIGRLDDDAIEVRVAAAQALGSFGSPGAISALIAHAHAPHPDVRGAVAESLGRTRATECLPALEELLNDAEPAVRAAAATALGLLGTDRALDVLQTHRGDGNPLAKNAVTTALRRRGRS